LRNSVLKFVADRFENSVEIVSFFFHYLVSYVKIDPFDRLEVVTPRKNAGKQKHFVGEGFEIRNLIELGEVKFVSVSIIIHF
jgi:hypothetical protein